MLFNHDFRGDIDHLEWLKRLPLRPVTIVIGEVMAPFLSTTAINALLSCCGTIALTGGAAQSLLLGFIMVIPFNLFLFAYQNTFFLVFPARGQISSANGLESLSRAAGSALLRIIFLGILFFVALGFGFLGYISLRAFLDRILDYGVVLVPGHCNITDPGWWFGVYAP